MKKLSSVLAVMVLMFVFAGCGGSGGGTPGAVASPTDTTAPTVSLTAPADNATNVAPNAAVSVTFSETMDVATVTPANIVILGVAGTVALNGSVATFTPIVPLLPSTNYTAMVTASVKDLAGNAMAADYTWSFTTAAAPHINPVHINPVVNGIPGQVVWDGTNYYVSAKRTVSGNSQDVFLTAFDADRKPLREKPALTTQNWDECYNTVYSSGYTFLLCQQGNVAMNRDDAGINVVWLIRFDAAGNRTAYVISSNGSLSDMAVDPATGMLYVTYVASANITLVEINPANGSIVNTRTDSYVQNKLFVGSDGVFTLGQITTDKIMIYVVKFSKDLTTTLAESNTAQYRSLDTSTDMDSAKGITMSDDGTVIYVTGCTDFKIGVGGQSVLMQFNSTDLNFISRTNLGHTDWGDGLRDLVFLNNTIFGFYSATPGGIYDVNVASGTITKLVDAYQSTYLSLINNVLYLSTQGSNTVSAYDLSGNPL
jgi:hypothetical protein